MEHINFNSHATHPLQTWEWGEFRKKTGNRVYRTDSFQLTIHPIPFFKKLKIGAFIKGQKPTKAMLKELFKIAKKENLIFIKLEPNVLDNPKDKKLLKSFGAIPGKTLFTPSSFWIDLTKPEEELLKSFHPKTRYNIRLAEKHGVKVSEDNSQKAFETFLKLYRETTQRQKFYAHNEKYFRLMWEELAPAGIAKLLVAKYKGKTLASWIVFVWKDFLYYPYGASSEKHKNVMASSLLMWEAIKYGKKLNLKTFDLWGREEGKGFTKFKEGFNPQVVQFLGTWDLPTSPFYPSYRLLELLRWKALRLKAKVVKPKF
jgi:lipid II:glycine glycyltransferase (peptidoglycan interpeptide bridge formation enzyme)